jgi:hypothetical protein
MSWPQMLATARVLLTQLPYQKSIFSIFRLHFFSFIFILTIGKDGKLKWKIADDNYYSSYTYIDNLCYCEYLAATKLNDINSVAAGKAYNVNDGVELKFWSQLYEV